MAGGRNGSPSAGSLRTAERSGGHAVERSGGTRARAARNAGPRPVRGQGPYDVEDVDPGVSTAPGMLDLGALRVPVPSAGDVSVEPTANGRMQAVHVTLPGGRLSVSALAAPKSSKLWPQLAKEIDASLREGGARVRSFKGEWGRELHATTGAATSVFVGVDGPRWMVYGVATGPSGDSAELDAELRRMLRGTVVVRGKAPYPVRTVLPLTAPELADQAPAPAEEPGWADPVHRIADSGATEIVPEDEAATAADVPTTTGWPVDEATDPPAAPEWLTGEQDVQQAPRRRRRSAPPVEEMAAALTEPILLSAVNAADPGPDPGSGPAADVHPPSTGLPPTPPAGPPAEDEDTGIDAYYGWDRPATARPDATPVDPLDPSAPVDTRWLDEPGVTTAWEAVVAARSPQPEPAPAAPDWEEWARQELDRAVAERAAAQQAASEAQSPASDKAKVDLQKAQEPVEAPGSAGQRSDAPDTGSAASFWERYGLEEPGAGGRAARRHGAGEPAGPAREGGRRRRPAGTADEQAPDRDVPGRSAQGELDPFTARRRSREAGRGKGRDLADLRAELEKLDEPRVADPVAARERPARRPDAGGWAGGWPGVSGGTPDAPPSVPDPTGETQTSGTQTSETQTSETQTSETQASEAQTSGRRHADGPGGSSRLSVAELAERAGSDRTARRGRHYRPGTDEEH